MSCLSLFAGWLPSIGALNQSRVIQICMVVAALALFIMLKASKPRT